MLAEPERYFEQVIEIDLSELEPHVVGPHRPDLARPISELAGAAADEGYPDQISAALVGSCTNSSYEDISRAADLARQAAARGAKARIPFLVTPGSEMVRATIERDGQLQDLESIGAVVLANACGPCIGQWRRDDITPAREGDPPKRNLHCLVVQPEFPAAERRESEHVFVPDESGGSGGVCAGRAAIGRPDGFAGGRGER